MAVTRELKQIHDLQTFIPMDAESSTEEEKQKSNPITHVSYRKMMCCSEGKKM